MCLYTKVNTSLALETHLVNPTFTAHAPVNSIVDVLAVDTVGLTANAVSTHAFHATNLYC